MKTVLCFGDSNTYGYSPIDGTRFAKGVRWTSILQEELGVDYEVIEEGCNGRTTKFDDPYESWKNGLTYIKPCINSHKPVDIVIMMLGTNDLKKYFNLSAAEIAQGAESLVRAIEEFSSEKGVKMPTIILVSPPVIGKGIATSCFGCDFDETAITRSKEFAGYYEDVANRHGCVFVDAAKVVVSSKEDSLHLMPEEHRKFAMYIKDVVLKSKNA